MEEYKTYKLGDVVNILDNKRVPLSSMQRQQRKGIYPYYGAQGVIDYIDDYLFDGEFLLIAEDGENLKSQKQNIAQIAKGKYWVNNHAHIVESNGLCDIQYVCYLLNLMDLSGYITGSAQPKLNQENLQKIEIRLPLLEKQHRIAKFLNRFDSKIELNRRINDNLEQQAQALFKSWFVDFEPFKDGEFVDSELGMIPKGWRVATLGEVTKQITEKVCKREDVSVLSPINSGELVLSEEYFSKQVFSKDLSKYIIVNPLSFAYNPARINIGSIGLNTFDFVGCVSPVYVVFECESNYHYFFDFYKKTTKFRDEVALRAFGGVRQSLGYNDFSLIKTIYPTSDVVVKFNNLYLKMRELIKQNTTQNDRFILLRDSLLTKLMSGEIEINPLNS